MDEKKSADLKARLKFFLTHPLVIIGVILIVCTAFGIVYLRQVQTQQGLSSEIALANVLLQQTSTEQLTEELEQVQAHLDEVQGSFLSESEVREVDIIDAVYEGALETGVQVASIQTAGVTSEKVGGSTYKILQFKVLVKGTLAQVLNFISALDSESEGLETLILSKASISQSGETCSSTVEFGIYMRSE